MNRFFLSVIFILGIGAIDSCINGSLSTTKKHVRKYYPSGALFSEGYYRNDSIPIDTLTLFLENGKESQKIFYSPNGDLVSQTDFYYSNGKLYLICNSEKNLLHGYSFKFNDYNLLTGKVLFYKGIQMGDCFFYNEYGKVQTYAFKWIDSTIVAQIEYDSSGQVNLSKNRRSALFYYKYITDSSLSTHNRNSYSVNIDLVISNPPRCRTVVFVDFVDQFGKVFKADSIVNHPLYSKKYTIDYPQKKLFIEQYNLILS